jgi:hypothetical protein
MYSKRYSDRPARHIDFVPIVDYMYVGGLTPTRPIMEHEPIVRSLIL